MFFQTIRSLNFEICLLFVIWILEFAPQGSNIFIILTIN